MTTETRNAPATGVSLPDVVKQLKAMNSMVVSAVLEEMKASLAREKPESGIGTRLPANACCFVSRPNDHEYVRVRKGSYRWQSI
jgi:hypothetical protein